MEWLELASTYMPPDAADLTAYDRFRLWADQNRVLIIFAYLIAVYHLGFAPRSRMPLLKMALLYILLFAGALIFGILDVELSIKSALFVAVVILVLVRVRNKRSRNQ